MKKLICASLAGLILLGFTSCDSARTGVSDTEAEETQITTESPTVSTTAEITESEKNAAINASLEDVRNRIWEFFDMDTSDISQSDFPDTVSANRTYGIKDYHYIDWLGNWTSEEGDSHFMNISITIIEFDMDSDTYKNLKVGDRLGFVFRDKFVSNFTVSAVNGQYVLCMVGIKDLDKENEYVESIPDYTIGNLQDIYLAFMEME